MRISTAHAHDAAIDSMARRQRDLTETQQHLVEGKRVLRASDDPAAAGRVERALAAEARSTANLRAVEASRTATLQTESALGDAGELLQQAREAMLAAGNASYGDPERKSLAVQIQSIRQQLLAVANRSDGAEGHLFGGQGAALPPFVEAPGGVQFRGTGGGLLVASDEALALSLDGRATWLSAPTGNGVFETKAVTATGAWIDGGRVTLPASLTGATYSVNFSVSAGVTTYSVLSNGAPTALTNVNYVSGQAIEIDGLSFTITGAPAAGDQFQALPSTPTLSVFDALDRTAADLATSSRTGAQISQSTARDLRDIDSLMSRLQATRTETGQTLNRIDSVADRQASLKLQAQTERSSAEDLDMVQAIAEFQNRQSGYDAALKSYSMVQRLSLFQYLNV